MTQTIVNLGTGGAVLNGRNGSTAGADSNDARFLEWPGDNAGNYVYLPGVSGNFMSVPDENALDITGDIDIRVQVAMDDWTPAATSTLLNKRTTITTNYAWTFFVSTDGKLNLAWSTTGNAVSVTATSSVATGVTDGNVKWVRATLDVDNGASGNDVKFWTSDDGVTWTQLGSTITTAGVTSVFASSALLNVGTGSDGGTTNMLAGKFYRAQIFNGIDGTKVLDIDTSVLTTGAATSFTALTGQTVTINRSSAGRKTVAVVSPCWLFGTDDYMEVADNDLIDFGASDSFTVLAVVRQWATPTSNGRIVSKDNQTAAGGGFRFQVTITAVPSLTVYDGTDAATATSTAISLGQLSVIAGSLTRITNQIIAYINGTASAAVSASDIGDTSSALPLRISSRASSAANFSDMELLAVAVFRRALTQSEIANITTYYQARLS